MIFKNMNLRPLQDSDIEQLETWRRAYWDGDLEIPKGYNNRGVETAAVENNGKLILSMTGTQAVLLDPLIKNPEATGAELVAGIMLAERVLAYKGQTGGAVDSYIAIPQQLTAYHEIVKKAGYVETVQACKIFRRPLMPDTTPLLGAERDSQRDAVKEPSMVSLNVK